MLRSLPVTWETPVQSLSREDPLRMDCLTPNPTFHTQGPPISLELPSITSWLSYTKDLQEDLLCPPSPASVSSQHSCVILQQPIRSHHFSAQSPPTTLHPHLTRGKASLYTKVPGPRKLALQPSSASPTGQLSNLNLSSPTTDLHPSRRLPALGPCMDSPTRPACLSTMPFESGFFT